MVSYLNTNLKYCLIILAVIALSSCGITKVVPDGELLLVKNKIERNSLKNINLEDERDYLYQKPNRELLGFIKFHLWAYQYGSKGIGIRKKQPWHRRLAESVGESPVLVDSAKMQVTAKRLSDYYFNQGFLNNQIGYNVTRKSLFKKRAIVTYKVELGNFHIISTLRYISQNKEIDNLIKSSTSQQIIRLGQRLDFDKIESESTRITELLRNNGFYDFNSSYISFKIDTNHVARRADLLVTIDRGKSGLSHRSKMISQIKVSIDEDFEGSSSVFQDITFEQGSYFIKPSILAKNIVFRPGELYDASKVQKTYANLLSMGLFEFVTIRFDEVIGDTTEQIVTKIILQTAPKHDFTWEPQAILTSRGDAATNNEQRFFGNEQSFGLANVFSLNNRNVFGGAEIFSISSLSAIESQLKGDEQGAFNNFRQSFNTELVIPSLVYFERQKISQTLVRKSTKINTSFLYDRNINFTRTVIPLSFTYAFSKGKTSYGLTPFRLSLNQATVDPNFLVSLDPGTRDFTQQLLTNNIIMGPTASISWDNKSTNSKSYWQLRSNTLEFSGNLASAYYALFKDNNRLDKELIGVKYSQYVRSDLDAVHTKIIDENNSIAYRVYGGAGYPYGNSRFLPFERRFFVGGSNSLRAWRPRTIGPGSFNDSSSVISIEKSGELMLQANIEYRFDIIDKRLDGAVFFDAGNIWNFREETDFNNAHFEFDRFYKEIALNTGFGLRFDLTYVVFRTDWGIALHDPSQLSNNRWVIRDFSEDRWIFDNTAINFAIGFPF